MPRVADKSYNHILTKPEFFDDVQKEEYLQKRILDTVLEDKIPPIPTREKELEYLDDLEKDFRTDRWIHFRFRKLQAGPYRKPYKETRHLVYENRMIKIFHFVMG